MLERVPFNISFFLLKALLFFLRLLQLHKTLCLCVCVCVYTWASLNKHTGKIFGKSVFFEAHSSHYVLWEACPHSCGLPKNPKWVQTVEKNVCSCSHIDSVNRDHSPWNRTVSLLLSSKKLCSRSSVATGNWGCPFMVTVWYQGNLNSFLRADSSRSSKTFFFFFWV